LVLKVSLKKEEEDLEVFFLSLSLFLLFLFVSSPPDEKGAPSRPARRDARI
jgi:hypothetical protein